MMPRLSHTVKAMQSGEQSEARQESLRYLTKGKCLRQYEQKPVAKRRQYFLVLRQNLRKRRLTKRPDLSLGLAEKTKENLLSSL
jgi:hypothetical protein